MKLLIGTDPELFAFDKVKKKYISAHALIPGTKETPHPVDGGAVQVDGMALEFNIVPDTNLSTVWERIVQVRGELEAMLPAAVITKAIPYIDFDFDVFDDTPDTAKELGCEPDYSAYTFEPNRLPADAKTSRRRTTSGHIHLGWTEGAAITSADHIVKCGQMVQQLEMVVGSVCTILEGNEGLLRKQLYGKAGSFRPKHYGLEYRTPASTWIRDENKAALVLEATVIAFQELAINKRFLPKLLSSTGDRDKMLSAVDGILGTSFYKRACENV